MKMSFHCNCDTNCSCSEDTSFINESNSPKMSTGIILIQEAQKVPNVLRLDVDSDVDDPDFIEEIDSEEDVVLLGEKHPIYEEITLEEEDDENEAMIESVVQKVVNKRLARHLEESLYHCPNCNKSFRVESLLKFHVRMHGVVESHLVMNATHETVPPSNSSNSKIDKRTLSSCQEKENKNNINNHSPKKQKHDKPTNQKSHLVK